MADQGIFTCLHNYNVLADFNEEEEEKMRHVKNPIAIRIKCIGRKNRTNMIKV